MVVGLIMGTAIIAFLCWCLVKRQPKKKSFTYHRSTVVGPPAELENNEKTKNLRSAAELDGKPGCEIGTQQPTEVESNQRIHCLGADSQEPTDGHLAELSSRNEATEQGSKPAEWGVSGMETMGEIAIGDSEPNPAVGTMETPAVDPGDSHQDSSDEIMRLQEEVAKVRAHRARLEELEALRAREAELEREIEEIRRQSR